MCSCFEVSDFVCFFTFFITAIVSLLFVQYFFVYLDSELDDKSRMFNSSRCVYFFLLTLLGCLVFAGIQRRSIFLLKWPSRLLVTLLIIGLVSLTIYLWVLDRRHQSVRDLEGKTLKLGLVIILLLLYSGGIQRFICQLNRPTPVNANARFIFDQSDPMNETHPMMTLLTESFRKKTVGKTRQDKATSSSSRGLNVASNGVNYYQLLLEGSGVTSSGSKFIKSKDCQVSWSDRRCLSQSESTASITEV